MGNSWQQRPRGRLQSERLKLVFCSLGDWISGLNGLRQLRLSGAPLLPGKQFAIRVRIYNKVVQTLISGTGGVIGRSGSNTGVLETEKAVDSTFQRRISTQIDTSWVFPI